VEALARRSGDVPDRDRGGRSDGNRPRRAVCPSRAGSDHQPSTAGGPAGSAAPGRATHAAGSGSAIAGGRSRPVRRRPGRRRRRLSGHGQTAEPRPWRGSHRHGDNRSRGANGHGAVARRQRIAEHRRGSGTAGDRDSVSRTEPISLIATFTGAGRGAHITGSTRAASAGSAARAQEAQVLVASFVHELETEPALHAEVSRRDAVIER